VSHEPNLADAIGNPHPRMIFTGTADLKSAARAWDAFFAALERPSAAERAESSALIRATMRCDECDVAMNADGYCPCCETPTSCRECHQPLGAHETCDRCFKYCEGCGSYFERDDVYRNTDGDWRCAKCYVPTAEDFDAYVADILSDRERGV
jgi:hypothetical protein